MIRVSRFTPVPFAHKDLMGGSTELAAISGRATIFGGDERNDAVTLDGRDSVPGGMHRLASGYSLPRIGFGTNTLRKRAEVFEALEAAVSAGHRCFDVAATSNNVSEIGRALEVGCLLL
jgi:hypothetical protein